MKTNKSVLTRSAPSPEVISEIILLSPVVGNRADFLNIDFFATIALLVLLGTIVILAPKYVPCV